MTGGHLSASSQTGALSPKWPLKNVGWNCPDHRPCPRGPRRSSGLFEGPCHAEGSRWLHMDFHLRGSRRPEATLFRGQRCSPLPAATFLFRKRNLFQQMTQFRSGALLPTPHTCTDAVNWRLNQAVKQGSKRLSIQPDPVPSTVPSRACARLFPPRRSPTLALPTQLCCSCSGFDTTRGIFGIFFSLLHNVWNILYKKKKCRWTEKYAYKSLINPET